MTAPIGIEPLLAISHNTLVVACGVAAVGFAAGVIGCFGGPSRLDWPILSSLAVALVAAAVYARARDAVVAGITLVPLLRAFYVGTQSMKGWRYVVLSFALLAVGALTSLRKGRHDRDAPVEGTASGSLAE